MGAVLLAMVLLKRACCTCYSDDSSILGGFQGRLLILKLRASCHREVKHTLNSIISQHTGVSSGYC